MRPIDSLQRWQAVRPMRGCPRIRLALSDPWRGSRGVAGSKKAGCAGATQALRPPDIGTAHPPIARAMFRETTAGADVSRETTLVIDKHCGASLQLGLLPLYASFI